jgi:hypothetical protein
MDVDNKGFYVHERLPTHRGMSGANYNRRLWHMRGVKFDEHGIPIIVPPKATKPKKKSESSAAAGVDEGLEEGEPPLGIYLFGRRRSLRRRCDQGEEDNGAKEAGPKQSSCVDT